MAIPRWVARANRYALNPVARRVAPHWPGFGVIIHIGRKSGREYRTPVNVFEREGGYAVALTYGRESEWVRNVIAAGGCQLLTRGRTVQLSEPRLFHDEQRRAVPTPVRIMLGFAKVHDFLELSRDER